MEVKGGPRANLINLNGVARADFTSLAAPVVVKAGAGHDEVRGSDQVDNVDGETGNDRIAPQRSPAGTRDVVAGGDGHDTLVWNPGDGDDTMDGEGGTDTIEVNGGGGGEEFEVKPSATPGRVAVRPPRPDAPPARSTSTSARPRSSTSTATVVMTR